MSESMYYFVEDVMRLMEIKERKAYDIIKTLNQELQAAGTLTISGRVPKKYFHYRYDVHVNEAISTPTRKKQCQLSGQAQRRA